MDPKDKVIIVTGASGGIGLASSRALARAGAHVVLAARSIDATTAEAARLIAAGRSAMAVEMDVTSDELVASAVAHVLQRFGRIDAVVNFAGNAGALAFWDQTSRDHTRAMFDVHLFGAERVTRAVLPAMLARGRGTVVNIASSVGWVAMPSAAAYSAAKAAILSFSEALRGELAGRGIDVMVFAPPHTSTEAGRQWPLEGPRIYPPEWVAGELVRTLRRGRHRFLAGASNRMLLAIQRLSPGYATCIMRRIGLRAVEKVLTRDRRLPAGS
jgi:NAD(P)-dependent dehydrogenase (short-subunit alcohol dehydrogenase family)